MTTNQTQNDNDPIIVTEEKKMPNGVEGWCWGGFFLGWIWGLGNRTYWALLCLVPGVNIIMHFVLGVKGREWAWKNNTWQSVEDFKRVQRIWSIVGLVVSIVVLVCFAPVLFMMFVFGIVTFGAHNGGNTTPQTSSPHTTLQQAAITSSVKTRRYYCHAAGSGTLVFDFKKQENKLSVFNTEASTCMGPWRSYTINGKHLSGSWGTRARFKHNGKALVIRKPANWSGTYRQCQGPDFNNPC